MTRRVVVIGADAAGMSAASQALRRAGREALDVVAFERGHHVSYSARGIPYWVAGVALWNEMTVEEMTGLDLGYAPPFSPVCDPVLVAARAAAAV